MNAITPEVLRDAKRACEILDGLAQAIEGVGDNEYGAQIRQTAEAVTTLIGQHPTPTPHRNAPEDRPSWAAHEHKRDISHKLRR